MGTKRIPVAQAPVVNNGRRGGGRQSTVEPLPVAPMDKPPKLKLIRDGFTIPEEEYRRLAELKIRTIGLKRPAKKSELLRAGIIVLGKMNDRALLTALMAVPLLKTGRPRK